jgi:hypothetical protein
MESAFPETLSENAHFWEMNYNTVLTDKPSDSSLTDILSGWGKLAGKPQCV